MKCKLCEEEMNFVYCADNGGGGSSTPIADNLYCSDMECMATLRNEVWDFSGQTWITDGKAMRNLFGDDNECSSRNLISPRVVQMYDTKVESCYTRCLYGTYIESGLCVMWKVLVVKT